MGGWCEGKFTALLWVPYANGYNRVFGYRMDNPGGGNVCTVAVCGEILIVL
jgi:hypothetical protein